MRKRRLLLARPRPGRQPDYGLPLPPDDGLALPEEVARRVEMTVSCRDADSVPKVPDGGTLKLEGGTRTQVMHDGSRIVAGCYHGVWMTEIIRRLRGHHEPQEELVFHRLVERLRGDPSRPPGVVMELGSFWSYYSIWAMRALGTEAVLVEPDPGNLEVGRVNLAMNGLSARVIQAAVGGEHGSPTQLLCESDGVERTVPVVTVDGVLADQQLDAVDLLMVDTQGGELDVLERSVDLLRAGTIRFIVVSTHHHAITGDPMTHQRCLQVLALAGAHIVAEHTVGESFSGDGLIVASTRASDRDLVVPVSHARYRESLFGELEPDLAAAWQQIAQLSEPGGEIASQP
jgi:FkbM family methyltransferase